MARSYGYDVIPSVDDRGRRVINLKEAAIVRRIYAEYVAGKGTMAIVRALNQEGEPGPSGGAWNLSALVGSHQRRNGLLNNELYNGTIVYNRQRFVKDPTTGKRVSRANPESEWQRQDAPDLRIVDEDIWQKAQVVRAKRSGPVKGINKQRGPKRLLSGLVYCGCCGAKYNIATQDFMRCSARTNSGTCMDSRLMRVDELERRVLAALETRVLTDEGVRRGRREPTSRSSSAPRVTGVPQRQSWKRSGQTRKRSSTGCCAWWRTAMPILRLPAHA